MIDLASGTLLIDGKTRVYPAMGDSALSSAPAGAVSDFADFGNGWRRYATTGRIGGKEFLISWRFFLGRLESLRLSEPGAPGESWDNWTEEQALERKCRHDTWLDVQLGPPPYDYPWGTIASLYDSRSGSAGILIRYAGVRGDVPVDQGSTPGSTPPGGNPSGLRVTTAVPSVDACDPVRPPLSKKYIEFDPKLGFPSRKSLSYECGICGDTIASLPERSTACTCRNVRIDVDAGRISVTDESNLRLFDKLPDRS